MQVYVITCSVNGKRYVGVTSRADRFSTHCRNALTGRSGALYNAIRKYGEGGFTYSTLCRCTNVKTAKLLEQKYIKKLNTRAPYGYNLTNGGDGLVGLKHARKTRRVMAEIHTERQKDPELRARTSCAMKAYKKTPEHRAKIAAALTGRKLSAATRAKISSKLTGRKQSLETKLKRAATLRSVGHRPSVEASRAYWKGRPKSTAQRAKLSQALQGRKAPEKTRLTLLEWARKPKSLSHRLAISAVHRARAVNKLTA
jgi:group I intron endonuclease